MLGHQWDEERRLASYRSSFLGSVERNFRFYDSLNEDDRVAYEAAAMRANVTGKPAFVTLNAHA